MKNKKSLLIWIIIISIVCFSADGLIYYQALKREVNTIHNTLKHYSDISLAAINPDRIESLSKTLTEESPDFDRLRTQLIKLEDLFAMDGIDSIYTMKQSGNDILFVVDSVPVSSPDYSSPGEKYLKPPKEVYSVMSSGATEFAGPYSDEYGEYYSYFVPIRRFTDGVIVGTLGLDIKKAYFEQIIRGQLPYYFGLVLLVYLFVIAILFFAERIYRSRQELSLQRRISGNLINVIPDVFYLIDKEGKLSLVNKSFTDRLEVKGGDITKIDFLSLFKGDNILKLKKSIELAYKSGGNFVEAELTVKDGRSIVFEFYNTVFRDEKDELVGVAGRGHDISIRHQQVLDLAIQKEKLEKINNLMIGRELKMVELKEENSKLKGILESKK